MGPAQANEIEVDPSTRTRDWYARAKELGLKNLMLPDILMLRRIHKGNQGIYKRQYRTAYTRVVKAALDRRRKKGDDGVKS